MTKTETEHDQLLIDEIVSLMENPPESSVVMTITPGLARWVWENCNTRNRALKETAVKRYQKDMAADNWLMNGSTIVFTDKQRLGDGQNRMAACIRAGAPFRTHAIFGVDDLCFYSMDQGKVRTPGDVLHLEGVQNSEIMASAVRWAELLARGHAMKRSTTFTSREILELWRTKHSDLRDFLPEARAIGRQHHEPVPMVCALLYTFNQADPDLAPDFAEAWAMGSPPLQFHALRVLENEMNKLKQKTVGRIHEAVRAAMIINAWNVCKVGRKGRIHMITWDIETQTFPIISGLYLHNLNNISK
jgi:hypothetical protein